jgi:hypothetical protein
MRLRIFYGDFVQREKEFKPWFVIRRGELFNHPQPFVFKHDVQLKPLSKRCDRVNTPSRFGIPAGMTA